MIAMVCSAQSPPQRQQECRVHKMERPRLLWQGRSGMQPRSSQAQWADAVCFQLTPFQTQVRAPRAICPYIILSLRQRLP